MKTYCLEEAAKFLNISCDTMRDLAADGTVAGAKIGKGWVFSEDDLSEYLRDEIRKQTLSRRNATNPNAVKTVEERREEGKRRRAIEKPPSLFFYKGG